MVFCHRRLAVMNLHFIKKRTGQVFITQGMGQTHKLEASQDNTSVIFPNFLCGIL